MLETMALEKISCPLCNSSSIIRYGHDCNHQRYRCKDCGKTFAETKLSIFEGSSKSLDVWRNYFYSMVEGSDIRASAYKCGITLKTSFIWRHKLLSALCKVIEDEPLPGDVSFETVFIKSSYKGNRKNVRKPKLYIGISSAMSPEGKSRSKITSINKMTSNAVDYALSDSIKGNSDGYTEEELFDRLALHKNVKLSHIKNAKFRVKNVEPYKNKLGSFFERFNGVSTKYLKNYLAWLDLSENKDEVFEKIIHTALKIRVSDIENLPAIPYVPNKLKKEAPAPTEV